MIPKRWVKEHDGHMTIIAWAWYQPTLDDDFARGVRNDLWGRLMGAPFIKVPPAGTPVLEREWTARWTKGGTLSFESSQATQASS